MPMKKLRMAGFKAGSLGLAFLFLLAGCKDKPPEPVSIKGKVQYEDGKPVSEMVLTFHPMDETNKNTRPVQVTDKKGNFSIPCVKGRYKVTLAALPKGPAGGGAGGPSGGFTPGADSGPKNIYRDPQKTPWLIDVPEKGKVDIVLTVKNQ